MDYDQSPVNGRQTPRRAQLREAGRAGGDWAHAHSARARHAYPANAPVLPAEPPHSVPAAIRDVDAAVERGDSARLGEPGVLSEDIPRPALCPSALEDATVTGVGDPQASRGEDGTRREAQRPSCVGSRSRPGPAPAAALRATPPARRFAQISALIASTSNSPGAMTRCSPLGRRARRWAMRSQQSRARLGTADRSRPHARHPVGRTPRRCGP